MDVEDINEKNIQKRLDYVQAACKLDEAKLKKSLRRKQAKRRGVCKPEEGIHCGPYQDFLETKMAEKLSEEIVEEMINVALAFANTVEIDDSPSEANAVRREVATYRAGLDCVVPQGWSPYHKEAIARVTVKKKESDPEYKEYLRLRNKFGN